MSDFSASGIQVFCYLGDAEPLEITRSILSIAPIKTNGLDITGYVKVETSLTLVGTRDFLETRFNLRWAKGNKVEIKVRNSQEMYVLHRTLRILDQLYSDDPKRPTLELKLGCLFALKDSRYPNPGDLKIPILENTPDVPILTTCNYWLRTFGLPETTVLPSDYSPPERLYTTGLYSGGNPIMEHIGSILYKNSRCCFWVDAQERVRIRHVDLAPSTIDFEVQPRDLAVYKRSTGEREKVAGTVRVLGVSNFKSPYQDPPPTTTSTTQGTFQTSETIRTSTTSTSRSVIKRGTAILGTGDNSKIGQYEEITVESYTGGFPQQTNPNPILPPIPGLPPWLDSVTQTLREQRLGSDGKLTELQTTKLIVNQYRYRLSTARHQGLLVHGVEIEHLSEVIRILPEGETTLKEDQAKTEDWIKLAPDKYLHTASILRPETPENRRYTKTIDYSPPPATQFAPSMVVVQQIEMYGVARFSYPPNAPDNDHPREYNCGAYLDNSGFAKKLAQQMGALLIGRSEAQEIGLRPSDAWLAEPHPFPSVTIARNNLEQDLYLLDVAVLLLAKRSYLGGSGIWLGQREIATGKITPPYEIKQKAIGYGNKVIGYGSIALEAAA